MKNFSTFVMNRARANFYGNFIQEHSNDQRKLFKATKLLFNQTVDLEFPNYRDSTVHGKDTGHFFVQMIEGIRSDLDSIPCPQLDINNAPHINPISCFNLFEPLSEEDVRKLIFELAKNQAL